MDWNDLRPSAPLQTAQDRITTAESVAATRTAPSSLSILEKNMIKIMVLLHSAVGADWQSPPKGTSLKTLGEAEEQGLIQVRGEFQKRQMRLTPLGVQHLERDRKRLDARRM